MSQLALPHGLAQRFLNGFVHHHQILGGNESHEGRHKFPAAFHPMIDARISIFQFFGSDMRNDVFRAAVEIGSEVVAHQGPHPHEEWELKQTSGSEHNRIRHCIAPYHYRHKSLFRNGTSAVPNSSNSSEASSGDKPAFVPKPPAPADAGNHSVSPRSLHGETAATLAVSPTADVAADNYQVRA